MSERAIAVAVGGQAEKPAPAVRKTFLPLSVLIPGMIALAFLSDVGLRLWCPHWVYFRTWEVVHRMPFAEGPFDPSVFASNGAAYGDLARIANLPDFRQIRPETFRTDQWGFRNAPDTRPVRVVVAGDSFTAGGAVSDPDTLPARLSGVLGVRVYNAGTHRPEWALTKRVIERLGLHGGVVIWQESERRDIHLRLEEPDGRFLSMVRAAAGADGYARFHQYYQAMETWLAHSPLKMLATRAMRSLQNDRILPNTAIHNVVVGRLENGDGLLFLKSEVDKHRDRPKSARFFVELQQQVQATGNQLLVVLVPDKYTVYAPLLSYPPVEKTDSATYLNQLTSNIQQAGVRVMNLTAPLRRQAAADFPQRNYNYWIDDTHWNARGIQLAAEEISHALDGYWEK